MSHKFTEDEKVVKDLNETLPYGVSKVQLVSIEGSTTEAGKEFVELTVVNEEGVEDAARCWFVGGATNISFNTLQQIAVHIGKTDAEKEAAREAFIKFEDSDQLVAWMTEHCLGGELWFTKYYDPSRTYMAADGQTRRSVNRNVYGYEPKEKPELMPGKLSSDDRSELLNGAQDITKEAGSTVPKDWA